MLAALLVGVKCTCHMDMVCVSVVYSVPTKYTANGCSAVRVVDQTRVGTPGLDVLAQAAPEMCIVARACDPWEKRIYTKLAETSTSR